jgi:hypothetical protein
LGYDFSGVDKPKGAEDLYGLRYSAFVVPLVKSVQELNEENKKLKKELEELKAGDEEINSLKEQVRKLLNEKGADVNTSGSVSTSFLQPNTPNPFKGATLLRYHLAKGTQSARVDITNTKGQLLKTIPLNGDGAGQISLDAGLLAAGNYTYTLWVDGKKIEAKEMIVQK